MIKSFILMVSIVSILFGFAITLGALGNGDIKSPFLSISIILIGFVLYLFQKRLKPKIEERDINSSYIESIAVTVMIFGLIVGTVLLSFSVKVSNDQVVLGQAGWFGMVISLVSALCIWLKPLWIRLIPPGR